MEFEQLKKQLILEAHNHFVAVAKARPYVEFGNFVESLRRDDNNALIESIQKGVLAIIEGAFQRENDPNATLMKKAEKVTEEQLNEYIESDNHSALIELLYPFIISIIDQKNIKNTATADKIFTKAINQIQTQLSKFKPMNGGSPTAWLHNFANKFIVGPAINANMAPSKKGKVQKEVVPADYGNKSQYWEYVDETKHKGEKKYGKAINHKLDPETREPMVQIRWKGVKDINGNWKKKPITEWLPEDEVQAYNLKDHEQYALSMDAGSKNLDDNTTLGDTIEGKVEDAPTDGATLILDRIDAIFDRGIEASRGGKRIMTSPEKGEDNVMVPERDKDGNIKRDAEGKVISKVKDVPLLVDIPDNVQKAVKEYLSGAIGNTRIAENARQYKKRLITALKDNKLPQKVGSTETLEGYNDMDDVKKGIKYYDNMIAEHAPTTKASIITKYGISKKQLDKYISLVIDELKGDSAVVNRKNQLATT